MALSSIIPAGSIRVSSNTDIGPNAPGVGPGMTGQSGSVPNTEGYASSSSACLNSLVGMLPPHAEDDVDVLCNSVEKKRRAVTTLSDEKTLTLEESAERTALAKKLSDLADAQKKIDAQQHCSFWAKIENAFEYVAAAISAVLAVTTSWTGVGAAVFGTATALLLISAMSTTISFTNDAGLGLFGEIAKAICPHDPNSWPTVDMWGTIVVTALSVIASIATCFFNPTGVSASVAKLITIAKMISTVTKVISAVGDIVVAGINLDAAFKQRAADLLKSDADKLEAIFETITDYVTQLTDSLKNDLKTFNNEESSMTAALDAKGAVFAHSFSA